MNVFWFVMIYLAIGSVIALIFVVAANNTTNDDREISELKQKFLTMTKFSPALVFAVLTVGWFYIVVTAVTALGKKG